MSAREIIEHATAKACGVGNLNGLTVIVGKERELIEIGLRRLEAAGYRLIPPGSLDRETIEKCAAVADNVSKSTLAQEAWDPNDDDYSCEAYEEAEYAASVASSIAAAIRALGAEK